MYSTHVKVLGKATMTLGFDWFAKQSTGLKPDHTRPNLLFSSFLWGTQSLLHHLLH